MKQSDNCICNILRLESQNKWHTRCRTNPDAFILIIVDFSNGERTAFLTISITQLVNKSKLRIVVGNNNLDKMTGIQEFALSEVCEVVRQIT